MGIRRCVHNEGTVAGYRFNPYDMKASMIEVTLAAPLRIPIAAAASTGNAALLHAPLTGHVAFYPFPEEAYPVPEPMVDKEQLARIFLGQLPYGATDMQLAWLCGDFARGSQLFYNERILKKSATNGNKRMPTGCFHTYCDPRDVNLLIELLDKRVLFDDCGIWYAEDEAQKHALHAYCQTLKEDPTLRPADRPYQPVVVQPATSTYIPNLNARRRTPPATPPPAYNF